MLVAGLLATAGCAQPGAAAQPVDEHVAIGPLAGRTGAFLTLQDAAGRVQVTLATLPGLLYRISTPGDSGLKPRVRAANGRVDARLVPTGDDGNDEVRIVLNRDVRWDIRLPAGAGEQQLDLRHGRVAGVGVGSAGLVEMRLPAPSGTVPVTLAGAGSAVVTTLPGTPLRIRFDHGAGSAFTPWSMPGPVLIGTVVQSPSWPAAAHRYSVRALGGLGSLTVS